jgi:hypothetical protein
MCQPLLYTNAMDESLRPVRLRIAATSTPDNIRGAIFCPRSIAPRAPQPARSRATMGIVYSTADGPTAFTGLSPSANTLLQDLKKVSAASLPSRSSSWGRGRLSPTRPTRPLAGHGEQQAGGGLHQPPRTLQV